MAAPILPGVLASSSGRLSSGMRWGSDASTPRILCVRITIDLPDDLVAELKRRAAFSRRTLEAVIASLMAKT